MTAFDLSSAQILDHHSHAGLYERRLGRTQTLSDLDTADPHYASSAYRVLLREAYAELYGDEARWSAGVDAQYTDGVEAAYTRMLRRLGIRATLWDARQLARADWPLDVYRLIYWIDPFICPWRSNDELQPALREALSRAGLAQLPRDFTDYVAFVDSTLHRARSQIVGLKLLLGYHRSLRFEQVAAAQASAAYAQRTDSTALQDFMVHHLFALAGTLDLPLQIHASFGGPNSNLTLQNNDPSLLQPLLENTATRVVLLHGGYPFISHAGAMAWMYQNVFLDFSVLPSLFAVPLMRWLEEWLELLPRNKLLFGSDASSPELYFTAAVNGRRQLGRALDNLVAAGGLSRPEAAAVADHVLYKNAVALYSLSDLA